MIRLDEITGVVLAGGKSTRMGRDKALLMLEGKPFIQHVAGALQSVLPEVIISANTCEYDFLGLPVVSDEHENCGPLGGIHAALGYKKNPHILITPCDAPFLNSIMCSALLEESEPGMITVASALDHLQPLVGVYPRECLSGLEAFLASGQRKVKDFLVTAGYRVIDRGAWATRLQNINDVVQYRSLLDSH